MGATDEEPNDDRRSTDGSNPPQRVCEVADSCEDVITAFPPPDPHAEEEGDAVADVTDVRHPAAPDPLRDDVRSSSARRYVSEARRPLTQSQRIAFELLDTSKFRVFINSVIIANSCTVGVDQSLRISGSSTSVVDYLEHVFIVIYLMELVLQLLAKREMALRDGWVLFDSVLVFIAVFSSWFLPVMSMFTGIGDVSGLGLALVLRTARLARLARAVRLIRAFRQLWLLVNAFLSSAKTMAYVVTMLGIILYMFSSVALEVITMRYRELETPDEIIEMVDDYFPTLPATMLTLLQFVCLDSIGQIYRPLILYDWVLLFYFSAVILVVGIVLMNIVTAIIVNSALQQSTEDREVKLMEEEFTKAKLMGSLRNMFLRLDADGSGTIDIEELKCVSGEDQQLLSEFSSYADPVDIFKALDIDGGGCLDIDEFCDGLYQVSVSQTPIEIKRVVKQMDRMLKVENLLEDISDQLAAFGSKGGLVPMLKERLSESSFLLTEGPPRTSGASLAQGAAGPRLSEAAQEPNGMRAAGHSEVAAGGSRLCGLTEPPAPPPPPTLPNPLPPAPSAAFRQVSGDKGDGFRGATQIADAPDDVGQSPHDLEKEKANPDLAGVRISSSLACTARETDKVPDKLDKMIMPFDIAQSEQRVLHELRMSFMRLERLWLVSCSQAKGDQKAEMACAQPSNPIAAKRNFGDSQPKLEEGSPQAPSIRASSNMRDTPSASADEEALPMALPTNCSLSPGRTLRSGFCTSFGLPTDKRWA